MKETNLNISVVASTNPDKGFPEFENLSDKYTYFGGLAAGICYMTGSFDDLKAKPQDITLRRAEMTLSGGHHSVFGHCFVSLYLENIPKLFAMLLNNEKAYVTSEKSARYTKMVASATETKLYNKWIEIFKNKIAEKYGNEKYFDEKRIFKLAQENARYLLSVYTPTNMLYTVSYRQLNYMYGWLKRNEKTNELIDQLQPWVNDFCSQLEDLGLINEKLANDQKNRNFSLFSNKAGEKVFTKNVYSTNYLGSFAELAQAQRHRTINYTMNYIDDEEFYIPKIIRDDKTYADEWACDMICVKSLVPQGKMITITETGTPEDLILKAKERLCTCAQLEINDQTKQTIEEYIQNCKDEETVDYLKKYNNGARCTFPDYTCPTPCAFKDGVNLDRSI